jgi:transaldolase
MDIYMDTAQISEIEAARDLGVLRGVTTNPSHMFKAGHRDFRKAIETICGLADVPVSAEVTAADTETILSQAREIATWAPNVVVKMPTTPEGLRAMAIFSREEHEVRLPDGQTRARRVPINATVLFSAGQAVAASLAGASYVSPFIGRLDAIGQEGIQIVRDIAEIFAVQQVPTKIISAALRNPIHAVASWRAGAHICTMAYSVLEQLIHHPLTDQAVESFASDWEKLQAATPQGAARMEVPHS